MAQRIYICSKFQNYETVRAVRDRLVAAGHEILCDWTTSEQFDPETGKPLNYNDTAPDDVQERRAAAECEGVENCTVFLVLGYEGLHNGLVELGMAIALRKDIHVVDPQKCWTIFFHTDVLIHKDIDAAVQWIAASS